jgi:methylated-DNA-protein-cysteine methyltransferase related protein
MSSAELSPAESRRARILEIVRSIAKGQVLGYGEVARLAGWPGLARLVARVLAEAEEPDLPWHRVLRSDGRIAFAAGSEQAREQARRLRAEGLQVDGLKVRMKRIEASPAQALDAALWAPPHR